MSRALVRSGKGRLHVAQSAGSSWLADCGSLITRPQEASRAVSAARLVDLDDAVCAYCRAIGRAVAHEQQLADEAAADAGLYALRTAGAAL